MSDKDKDGLSNQETDDLLASLNQRASSGANADAASQEEEEGGEDIEAFLADLESGDDAGADKAGGEQKQEPDPFADAFAELEEIHGDDVDAEFEAKYAALEAEADDEPAPEPAPKAKKTPEPEPHKPTPEAKAPAKESEPEPAKEEEEASDAKADKKGKKKKKKKDGEIAVVQSQQSKKVTFAIGAMKWSLLLFPVMLSWWLIGAFLGQWLETGWLIAIAATVVAFILPLILKLAIRRGKWAYYAALLGVLAVVGLVAPWPDTAGKRLSHYGHWPVSAVAQLAGWQPDHAAVKMTAWGAEVIGHQVEKIAPGQAAAAGTEGGEASEGKETLARALGTEKELVAHAEAQRVEAAKEKEKAGESAEDGEKASEDKADKADKKEEAKEEKPAEEKSKKTEEK